MVFANLKWSYLMKNIVMATDLSARSDRALERAISIAQVHDADLTIVHVVDDELPESLADAHESAARLTIQRDVDRLVTGDGSRVSTKVVFGQAYVDILEISEKAEADLIVLGMHRENMLKDMFRGTTVERVIRVGNIPVLLVKDRVIAPYQRAMVGVDFSVYSRRAVEFAVKFVPEGQFYLVHAYDVPFKGFLYGQDTRREVSKQQQAKFDQMIEGEMATFLSSLEGNPPRLERIMKEGMARQVVDNQVTQLKPDLLVIGTHGRTGAAHAFLGSVAEDILKNPPCDVLVVKAW